MIKISLVYHEKAVIALLPSASVTVTLAVPAPPIVFMSILFVSNIFAPGVFDVYVYGAVPPETIISNTSG